MPATSSSMEVVAVEQRADVGVVAQVGEDGEEAAASERTTFGQVVV
jgi:hypothetical protein